MNPDLPAWPVPATLEGRNQHRSALEAAIADPAVVAQAQAAVAVLKFDEYLDSAWVQVLAAEASDSSLDVLMPFIEHALKDKGLHLGWLRERVMWLVGETAAGARLKSVLRLGPTTADQVREFCEALGILPVPAQLMFGASFHGPEGGPYGKKFLHQLQVDSREPERWLQYRARGFEVWRSYSPNSPSLREQLRSGPELARAALRITSVGADRKKLQAWLDSFLTGGA